MPTMCPQDVNDTLLLCDTARKTITDVMIRNADKGDPGRWRRLALTEVLDHAYIHLATAVGKDIKTKLGFPKDMNKEDIECALVRCTMALIKMEKENGL
jgi:hypothetical protein